jgi:SAM-dependent methyltransferase
LPQYAEILGRLKGGEEKFLDLGCCFGQEIRRLVYDGAPSENLTGSDLRPEFFELGYELFKDRETLKSSFIAADIFDTKSELKSLYGTIGVLYAGSFLHLFGWEKQVVIAKRMVELLKPVPGSVVLGRQVGDLVPGERPHRTNPEDTMFRHNVESFTKSK